MADLKRPIFELPLVGEVVERVYPDESIEVVLKKLQERNIGAVIVVDQTERVVGIFTERDYIRKVAGFVLDLSELEVKNVMTPNPKTLNFKDPILRAAAIMRMGRFRHIVLVDEEHRPTGMVSVKDILDWMTD